MDSVEQSLSEYRREPSKRALRRLSAAVFGCSVGNVAEVQPTLEVPMRCGPRVWPPAGFPAAVERAGEVVTMPHMLALVDLDAALALEWIFKPPARSTRQYRHFSKYMRGQCDLASIPPSRGKSGYSWHNELPDHLRRLGVAPGSLPMCRVWREVFGGTFTPVVGLPTIRGGRWRGGYGGRVRLDAADPGLAESLRLSAGSMRASLDAQLGATDSPLGLQFKAMGFAAVPPEPR